MADLSDPNIIQAYTEIEQHQATNWLLLGYHDTRDVITLYTKGTGGLSEFRNQLSDEVLYGFVRVEDRFILITWISDQVSGVRRARALVHSRSVASLLKAHNAIITASSVNDLSDNNIRARLKLDITSKRLSKRMSQNEEFVEASEELPPPSPVTTTPPAAAAAAAAAKEEERQAALQRKQAEDEKRRADMAAAAAKERARLAAEEEERRKKQEAATLARAEAEAKAKKAREEEEAKRRQALRAQEEEKKKKAEAEKRRMQEEEMMKRRMLEAEKNKDVMLSGFASVQPKTSPFWRRRYFTLRGKNLILYRDEQDPSPIGMIDLKSVTRLSPIDEERETFLPNAFVIDTQKAGSYQLFADNRRECETIFTALLTVMQAN